MPEKGTSKDRVRGRQEGASSDRRAFAYVGGGSGLSALFGRAEREVKARGRMSARKRAGTPRSEDPGVAPETANDRRGAAKANEPRPIGDRRGDPHDPECQPNATGVASSVRNVSSTAARPPDRRVSEENRLRAHLFEVKT
jgi:hypothetical protein